MSIDLIARQLMNQIAGHELLSATPNVPLDFEEKFNAWANEVYNVGNQSKVDDIARELFNQIANHNHQQ